MQITKTTFNADHMFATVMFKTVRGLDVLATVKFDADGWNATVTHAVTSSLKTYRLNDYQTQAIKQAAFQASAA